MAEKRGMCCQHIKMKFLVLNFVNTTSILYLLTYKCDQLKHKFKNMLHTPPLH